jgi:hypothetical protein
MLPSDTFFAGSNGLYHARFNKTAGANANTWRDYLEDEAVEDIMTSLEIPKTLSYWHSYDHITGFFEAPVDGLYQFHMSCDDNCKFLMSPASDPLNPDAKEELMVRGGHT